MDGCGTQTETDAGFHSWGNTTPAGLTGMKLPDLDTLRIVHYPDPVLKQVCQPVEEFGPDLKAFVDRMLDGGPFESTGEDYLVTVRAMEACYASAQSGDVVHL